MENSTKKWLLLVLGLLVIGFLLYYFLVASTDIFDNSEYQNGDNNQSQDIPIENQYENKIVYTTNTAEYDADVLRQDCTARGGEFQECGTVCAPDVDFCAEVCAYTCILDEDQDDNGDYSALEWETYINNDLGFSLEIPEEVSISSEADNRIEFMYEGPTQRDGTELYDGVRVLVSRLSYPQDQTLESFSENLAEPTEGLNTGIIEPVSLENEYDYATYTFTKDSLGTYKHYIAPIYPGEAFDISVFVSGEKYRAMTDRILENFRIIDQDKSTSEIEGKIFLTEPKLGQTIQSPLEISGEAVGTWFFEANFSATLVNWDGLIIAETPVQAEGEWMTEDFVPFSASLDFDEDIDPVYPQATLILQKANPSGLPENAEALEVPVYFSN